MYIKNIKKLIQISWMVIAIGTLLLGGILIHEKQEHKTDLDNAKLQNELLLSEKLALDKEILHYEDAMNILKEKNERSEKLFTEWQRKLTDRETAYSELAKENARTKSLKKQLAENNNINEDLLKKMKDLNHENSSQLADNARLKNSLLTHQGEKEELMKQLDAAMTAHVIKPDNYMVETHMNLKKDRLTYNAKRIKKLTLVLDMPMDHSTEISFNITTPEGKVITEKNKMLTWKFISNDKNLTASINPFDDELQASSQIKLTYTPTSKLQPGEYKIAVMKSGQNIGNCRVRLR